MSDPVCMVISMQNTPKNDEIRIAVRLLRGALSRRRFGDKLGVTDTTIYRWETGRQPVSQNFLLLLVGHGLDPKFLNDTPVSEGVA